MTTEKAKKKRNGSSLNTTTVGFGWKKVKFTSFLYHRESQEELDLPVLQDLVVLLATLVCLV